MSLGETARKDSFIFEGKEFGIPPGEVWEGWEESLWDTEEQVGGALPRGNKRYP